VKHVNNDYMKIQLQNSLLAEQIAEAAKLRQSERARAKAADSIESLQPETDEPAIKKVPGKTEDGNGGQKEGSRKFQKWRYRPDGTLEEDGGPEGGPSSASTTHIDIKA
jgi:hypothetical protein